MKNSNLWEKGGDRQMQQTAFSETEACIRRNRRRLAWQRVVTALAALVVFYTTYALILPALTLDGEMAKRMFGINTPTQDGQTHSYTDPAGRSYQVVFDGADLPGDTVLIPRELTAEEADYAALTQQVLDQLEGTPVNITLLDIGFYDTDGDHISVTDTARVSLDYEGDVFGDSAVRVFHFSGDGLVELEQVAVTQVSAASGEDGVQTHLEFETEGFSVFAVVEVSQVTYTKVTAGADALDGMTVYLRCNDNSHGILAELSGTDSLARTTGYGALWTLTRVGTEGSAYQVSSNGQYMVMSGGALTLTDDANGATNFTVTKHNDKYLFYDGSNYINEYGGCSNSTGFKGWTNGESDNGSHLILYTKDELPAGSVTVADLEGSYVIVSGNVVNTAITAASSGDGYLDYQDVTLVPINGETCVVGDATVWVFTPAGTEGTYTISTVVDGATVYLNVNSSGASVSETSQVFTAEAADDGCIYLSDGYGNYINRDGSSGNFGRWIKDNGSKLKLYKLTDLSYITLNYDLNQPKSDWKDGTPSLEANSQVFISSGGNVLTVQGANDVGTFVANTISEAILDEVRNFYESHNKKLKEGGTPLTEENYLPPGREYRFLGWQVTLEGKTYTVAAGKEITLDATNNVLKVKATDGTTLTLPSDTTLTAQWEWISDVAVFYVNYHDTILEYETDVEVTGYVSGYYTKVVAFGRIFNPYHNTEKLTDLYKQGVTYAVISAEINEKIQAEIVPAYDSDDPTIQIVIDAVYDMEDGSYKSASNYNQILLETAVGLYLKNLTGDTAVKLDGAHIDTSEISSENYKLYWYSQKEVDNEGYHIDGVLVARTYPVEIYKTFSGLSNEDVTTLIGAMNFNLYLLRTGTFKTTTTDEDGDTTTLSEENTALADYYLTLKANSSKDGVYTAASQQGSSNIYKWTLYSVLGQNYAFAETDYELDDYDCSSLISVHYKNGDVKYLYNIDSTVILGEEDSTNSSYTYTNRTDSAGEVYFDDLTGGKIEGVIFANFYTKTGTGAFSVSKVDAKDTTNRLSGATFTLTGTGDLSSYTATATTNENGSAHFSNLAAGTYILTETEAPDGYQKNSDTWTVVVSKPTVTAADGTESTNVTVTIKGSSDAEATTVYDFSAGGIVNVYQVQNTPENTTLTITKTFYISQDEIDQLNDGGYYMELRDADGKRLTYTDSDGNVLQYTDENYPYILKLESQYAVTGQASYTWTLTGIPTEKKYTLIEYNYILNSSGEHIFNNYVDAVVSAVGSEGTDGTQNQDDEEGDSGEEQAKTVPLEVKKDGATAVISFTTTQKADSVTITNQYTDTFTLKLTKVDGDTFDGGTQKYTTTLEGAEFKLYTTDFTLGEDGESYTYNGQTVYYVATVETDNNGEINLDGRLKLSTTSTNYTYILVETRAPEGYVLPEDRVIEVRAEYSENATENYSNGVYSLTVKNTSKKNATVNVTVNVEWPDNADIPSDAEVTVTLYRVPEGGSAELVKGDNEKCEATLSADNRWTATWEVPYQTTATEGTEAKAYTYYVAVTTAGCDGYYTTYSTELTLLTVNGSSVNAALAAGSDTVRSVTVTNTAGVELPATGGSGTGMFYAAGAILLLATVPFLLPKRRTRS